ncbi:MAG: class I SAM-dependent methyltransferase [Firmicutes bacterium]|nr:class I SAM-dependent methyltransferase [Bacillota bacterium]
MTGWELQALAIKDYFNGDINAELLVVSDCAGIEKLPARIFFRNFDQLTDLDQYALSLCKGKVLDLGAGAGSHSLILQNRGFLVYSIDIAADAVEVMRRRGLRHAYCADASSLRGPKFDTILMMMNGLGVVQDLSGLTQFLHNIKRLLRPRGQILVDSSDLHYLEEAMGIAGKKFLKQGKDYGKISYRFAYKGMLSAPFHWLFIDQETLQSYASHTGWQCQIIFEEDFQYLARLFF